VPDDILNEPKRRKPARQQPEVQAPGLKRKQISEDDEPPAFRSYQYGSQILGGLDLARPSYGTMFESGVFGPRMYSAPAAMSPVFGSRARPEVILEDTEYVPTYDSRFQMDYAGAESAPKPKRRQLGAIGDGTRPAFQSAPVGSRFQDGFVSAEQVLGFEPRHQIRTSSKPITGEMVGPKRKARPPPDQETPQQGTSGGITIAPIVKASEKWKKKHIIENCPVIVPNGEGFIELSCYSCHCNASGTTGKFWLGGRGIQGHIRKIHKETLTPAETLARCCIRSVSAEEAKQIASGELVIEKVFYKKEGKQDESDAESEVDDDEEGEEEEARPVKTRQRHTKPRDFSKGKVKSTTW
jgi:hypothetical protein